MSSFPQFQSPSEAISFLHHSNLPNEYKKMLLPILKNLQFDPDTNSAGFRDWAESVASIFAAQFQEVDLLHHYINQRTGRTMNVLKAQQSVIPDCLTAQDARPARRLENQNGSSPSNASKQRSSAASVEESEEYSDAVAPSDEGEGKPSPVAMRVAFDPLTDKVLELHDLPDIYHELNENLYIMLQNIYVGSKGTRLPLPPSHATYTSAMIALWNADKLNGVARKIEAVDALYTLTYQGHSNEWKSKTLRIIREIYSSGFNLNDMIYNTIIRQFKNVNPECVNILTRQLNDLNHSADPTASQNWEKNLAPIVGYLLTSGAVTGSAPVHAIAPAPRASPSSSPVASSVAYSSPASPPSGFPPWRNTPPETEVLAAGREVVCGNCKQRNHHKRKNCPDTALDTGPLCSHCSIRGHTVDKCRKKERDCGKGVPTNAVAVLTQRAVLTAQLAALDSKFPPMNYVVEDTPRYVVEDTPRDNQGPEPHLTDAAVIAEHLARIASDPLLNHHVLQEGVQNSPAAELKTSTFLQLEDRDAVVTGTTHQPHERQSSTSTVTTGAPARAGIPIPASKGPEPTRRALRDAFQVADTNMLPSMMDEFFEHLPLQEGFPVAPEVSNDLSDPLQTEAAPLGTDPYIPETLQEGSASPVSSNVHQQRAPLTVITPDARPIFAATALPTAEPGKGTQKIVLSLFDGMGCAFTALQAAGVINITRALAVEINPTARLISSYANPKTDYFPGVDHSWAHDVYAITQEMIAGYPQNAIVAVVGGPECSDFSKNRLLPSTPAFIASRQQQSRDQGGKFAKEHFPRQGLKGKKGSTFRQLIKIIGWVKKHHPDAYYLVENVVFQDMAEDWAEVCQSLGTPVIINSGDYSTTYRYRAWWTNHQGLLDDPTKGMGDAQPIDPDTCMDGDRRIVKYSAGGVDKTRPLGACWGGNPDNPEAQSKRKNWVLDPEVKTLQDVNVSEAEKLHGFKEGHTAAPGVTKLDRMKAIGGGWDLNIATPLIRAIFGNNSDAKVPINNMVADAEAFKLLEMGNLTPSHYDLLKIYSDCPSVNRAGLLSHLDNEAMTVIHFLAQRHPEMINHAPGNPINLAEPGSILDSGASKHVCRTIEIEDATRSTRLCGFEGSSVWTEGSGFLPIACSTKNGNRVQVDISDVDKSSKTASNLLSMGKLIKENWQFHLTKTGSYATLPDGQRLALHFNADDILVFPHEVRQGAAAARIPSGPATLAGMITASHSGTYAIGSAAPVPIATSNIYDLLDVDNVPYGPQDDDEGPYIDDGQDW